MLGSAGAVAAALNHAHESSRLSSQRAQEHKEQCQKLVADFDTSTASAERTQEYVACKGYLTPPAPRPESHSSIGMWFGITVTAIWLIGGAIAFLLERRKPAQ